MRSSTPQGLGFDSSLGEYSDLSGGHRGVVYTTFSPPVDKVVSMEMLPIVQLLLLLVLFFIVISIFNTCAGHLA